MVLCCICVNVWQELVSLLVFFFNLFLSLSASSIANIRRWVFLNCLVLCMCMWIFDQKYNLFLSCLLVSLPTLAGEFYWMNLCCAHVCMFDQNNCFSFCLLTLMLNISKWVYWMVLCMCVFLTRSNLFLIWSAHSGSIANNQEVSLWSLFVCLTRSNLFLSLSALYCQHQRVSFTEWSCVVYVCMFDQK